MKRDNKITNMFKMYIFTDVGPSSLVCIWTRLDYLWPQQKKLQ